MIHPIVSRWPRAKIAPPTPRALISRPRLLRQIDRAAEGGQATLIVAPGGTGKTSLGADWARQTALPVAWYLIDDADRDPRRLTEGLCAAVERALPGRGEHALAALERGSAEQVAIGLLFAALEDQPLALVLDDLHLLDEVSEANALFEHLLRIRPAGLSLIILSRNIPILGFAAMMAMDLLLGLGSSDLAFDAAEAAALVAAHGFDAGQAARLSRRTGGWAAGILLLARAGSSGMRLLRERADAMLERLVGEILTDQPPEMRRFLLESSALGPTTAPVADRALGREDSAERYADLLAQGLFVEESDGLYRYHDLFAEQLLRILLQEEPARLDAIRRAATDAARASGDVPAIMEALVRAEQWEELASTLAAHQGTLWAQGRYSTIVRYVEAIPEARRSPLVTMIGAYARAERGEHAAVLAQTAPLLEAASDDRSWLRATLLQVKALQALGRYAEAAAAASAALPRARHSSFIVERLQEMLGMALLRLGRLDEGRREMLAAVEIYRSAGDEEGEARTHQYLGSLLADAGRGRMARSYLERAADYWARMENTAMQAALAETQAMVALLGGELAAAETAAKRAVALAEDAAHPTTSAGTLATYALVLLDAGRLQEAAEAAEAADRLGMQINYPEARIQAARALIGVALLRRDRGAARALIDEARAHATGPVEQALLDALDGALAMRTGAHARARELLAAAADTLETVGRPHEAARAQLLLAETHLVARSRTRAVDALGRMAELVSMVECRGYLLPLARLVRLCIAERRNLRRLGAPARLLLDEMARRQPALQIVAAPTEGAHIPTLRISPFGDGQAWLDGAPVDLGQAPPRARELLHVAARAGGPLHRSAILDAIWEGDARGEQALWDATRHLRRILGTQHWQTSGRTYRIALPIHDDELEVREAATVALGGTPSGGDAAGVPTTLPGAQPTYPSAGTGGHTLTVVDGRSGASVGGERGRQARDGAVHDPERAGSATADPASGAGTAGKRGRGRPRTFKEGSPATRLAAAERALALAGSGGYLQWCESPWAVQAREEIITLLTAVTLAAGDLYAQFNRPDDALAAYRRAALRSPLDDAPRIAICRHLIAVGHTPAALREYRAYRRLLHSELGTVPGETLRALLNTATAPG